MRRIVNACVLSIAAAGVAGLGGCVSAGRSYVPPTEDVTLTFDSPAAMDDWVVTAGDWTVRDGLLHGRSLDLSGETRGYAVYATPFAEIERVVIRGSLEPDCPDSFRFAVGPLGVILNWELANDNIAHHGFQESTHWKPHALTPGRESEIVVEQVDRRIRLVVDDRVMWEDEGTLSGTVSLSVVLRSRVFVREVRIRGRPLHGMRVWRPSAPAP